MDWLQFLQIVCVPATRRCAYVKLVAVAKLK